VYILVFSVFLGGAKPWNILSIILLMSLLQWAIIYISVHCYILSHLANVRTYSCKNSRFILNYNSTNAITFIGWVNKLKSLFHELLYQFAFLMGKNR
jgi:hypothetical protein